MITQSELRARLHYDGETGLFTWLIQPSSKIQRGDIAGSKNRFGYVEIKISRKKYQAHRLAWLYVYGYFPPNQTDHIDGDRSNNRIANLRDVSQTINAQNRRASQRNNKLGMLGVHRVKNRFRAQIGVNGGLVRLGRFDTPEQAHEAYLVAKRKYHEGCTI